MHTFQLIHSCSRTRHSGGSCEENISKIVSLSSSERNHHFLLFVISTTCYENKVSAVEDSENAKMNPKEGSKLTYNFSTQKNSLWNYLSISFLLLLGVCACGWAGRAEDRI